MSRHDAHTFVTTSGVAVTVSPDPTLERAPRAAPPPPEPQVVVLPLDQPPRDRDAFIAELLRDHGDFMLGRFVRCGVLPESAKDLRQNLLLLLCTQFDTSGPPVYVRAFLGSVIRNVARNHLRLKKLDIDRDADADAALASAPDPQGTLELVEAWKRMERGLTGLSPVEAAVIQCRDFDALTVDETAELLDLPRGSVSTVLTRARARLVELAREP